MKALQVLLLYRHPITVNAPTIMDHVKSFKLYSVNSYINVNTEFGFPDIIKRYSFDVIIFHYSLFGIYPFSLPSEFIKYVKMAKKSVKVAFFQDEYQYCLQRFKLINDLNISVIYSLLNSENFDKVYGRCKSVKYVFGTLTGYISDDLLNKSEIYGKPFAEREIDFGYRARSLPYLMGEGAQDKTNIGLQFLEYCKNKDYSTDISMSNDSRIYGDDWYRFVGNCKAMLGVEAGVSIFDVDGSAEVECKKFLKKNPNATFRETYDCVLHKFEASPENVKYRMISPRIFETAALRVCMILFEGNYSNLLKPNVHYIALKKDFSNMDSVMSEFHDSQRRKQLVQNAYRDLIESKQFSFQGFVRSVDGDFSNIGILPSDHSFDYGNLEAKVERRESFCRTYRKIKYSARKVYHKLLLKS